MTCIAHNYKSFLFDLDGVIYLGDSVIPGTKETIEYLRTLNKNIRFLTNNPLGTTLDFVKKLNNLGIVIDVVVASEILKKVIKQFNYKNLDDLKEFQNLNTSMEVLCEYIHKQISGLLLGNFEGSLKVTIKENPLAQCSFEDKI